MWAPMARMYSFIPGGARHGHYHQFASRNPVMPFSGRAISPRPAERQVQEIARIRRFIKGDHEVEVPQSEVDAYVQRVQDTDGALLVYLYNDKQGGPDLGDCPTQSMHFEIAAARAFKGVLEAAIDPL